MTINKREVLNYYHFSHQRRCRWLSSFSVQDRMFTAFPSLDSLYLSLFIHCDRREREETEWSEPSGMDISRNIRCTSAESIDSARWVEKEAETVEWNHNHFLILLCHASTLHYSCLSLSRHFFTLLWQKICRAGVELSFTGWLLLLVLRCNLYIQLLNSVAQEILLTEWNSFHFTKFMRKYNQLFFRHIFIHI